MIQQAQEEDTMDVEKVPETPGVLLVDIGVVVLILFGFNDERTI